MNAFFQHPKDNISFHYRCFDRILLNASIQPFQQPERVVGFFSTYRNVYPVTRNFLRDIANQYQNWVTNRSLAWDAPILDDPGDRSRFSKLESPPEFSSASARRKLAAILSSNPAGSTNITSI